MGILNDGYETDRARLDRNREQDPGPLYDLWHRPALCPYIVVAHVQGRPNAGAIGLVAARDIVVSDNKATFSLSELLFGLTPARVLSFLFVRSG